jgi:hypothetical protein
MRSLALVLALSLLVLVLFSTSAMATPIVKVDGVLDGNDHYTTTLDNPTNPTGVTPDLEISTVTLAGDPGTGDAYLGLWVVGGTILTTGEPNGHLHQTLFTAVFSDNNSSLTHEFDILMSGSTITVAEDGVQLAPGSFTAATANGLEVMVHAPDIIALTNFSFYGLLDGRSISPNSEIFDPSVPEPATAFLALMGLPALLRRRKQS